jgi:hypothetical protein
VERIQEPRLKSWEEISSRLAFLGFCAWSLAIPFAQVQKIRFTAISIFIIIGAFLIFLPGKTSLRRIGKGVSPFLFIFCLIGILPLLDFWRWENPRMAMDSFVLRLPMIVLPFILYQFSFYWPPFWKIIIISCLITSSLINVVYFSSQGLDLIYSSIRNDIDHLSIRYITSRPYYGFLLGICFFSLVYIYKNKINILLITALIFFTLFEYLIVGKLFLVSSFICFTIYILYIIRNNLNLIILYFAIFAFTTGFIINKIVKTQAYFELTNQGGFDFSTIPKHYSNSINSRLILWKASKDILYENNAWIFGLGTQNFQDKLDSSVQKYNPYLSEQHLTSHNLFLGFWMQYGLMGLSVLIFMFGIFFKESISKKNISLFLLSTFLLLSVQTEIYMDREMGVHLFIWVLVVLYLPIDSTQKNKLST